MNKEIALVSGGSKGLGLAIVRSLLARGDSVATFARKSSPQMEELQAAHPSRFSFVEADITETQRFRNLVSSFEEQLGGFTGLVNNAGTVAEALLARQNPEDIVRLLSTNLAGPLLLTREVARGMMIRQRGRIINQVHRQRLRLQGNGRLFSDKGRTECDDEGFGTGTRRPRHHR